MRSVIIFLLLSTILFGIFSFMISNLEFMDAQRLENFKQEYLIVDQESFDNVFEQVKQRGTILQYINMNNFVALVVIFFLSLVSSMSSIHLFIDKMFFKTFYQDPDMWLALRRSLLFALGVCSLIVLKIIAVLNIWIILAIIFILALVEFMVFFYSRQVQNLEEEDHFNQLNNEASDECN